MVVVTGEWMAEALCVNLKRRVDSSCKYSRHGLETQISNTY